MQAEEIKKMIELGLPDAQVEIKGDDGAHFAAIVVSETFVDKTMVQQHQSVYKTLGDKMGGAIHALSIQTYTPLQWEKKKDLRLA